MEVIPAILTSDPQELKELINQLEEKVEKVQIDILDGVFAKNKTIDPSVLDYLETNLDIDFHLMVKEPISWVEKCVRAQGQRIIGQIEMMQDQIAFVGKVQEAGVKVGLALNLETEIEELDKTVVNNLDVVLVMAVPAGFGGQEFQETVIKKIQKLDKIRKEDQSPFLICVDGGVNEDNIQKIVQAGADEVAIGRRLLKGEIETNIKKIKSQAAQTTKDLAR